MFKILTNGAKLFSLVLLVELFSCSGLNNENNLEINYLYEVSKDSLGEIQIGYRDYHGNIVIPYGKYSPPAPDTIKKIERVNSNGKIYLINNKGKELFQLYAFGNFADSEVEGLVRIIENDRIGFANMNGEVVIPPTFLFVSSFKEGLAYFELGGIVKPQDRVGKEIPFDFGSEVCIPIEQSLYNKKNNIRYGFINKKREVVIEPIYDKVNDFENGRASVYKDGREFYIDKKGKEILDLTK